jgi:hypothetical protein
MNILQATTTVTDKHTDAVKRLQMNILQATSAVTDEHTDAVTVVTDEHTAGNQNIYI